MTFREKLLDNKTQYVGVGIDIIDGCNLQCRQCYYTKSKKYPRMISLQQMKYIIDKVQNKFSELYILGGEPTLHPDIAEIIKFGLERMPMVILVSNGIKLADENFCKKIAFPGLSISMHMKSLLPKDKGIVDFLTQKRGSFEKNINAWTNVIKCWKGEINVQSNIMKPLVENGCIMETFKWARKYGFEPIIELTKPGPIFKRGNPLDVSLPEIKVLYDSMKSYDETYYPGLKSNLLPAVPPNYGHVCTLVETGIHITVNGDVLPCVAHENIFLGNIFRDNIEDIMESDIRQAIRDFSEWIVGPCKKCCYFEFCRGGCRGEAFYDTGCPRASDPYCWHIPEGLTLRDMVPKTCEGCILEKNPGCSIRV